MATIAVVPILLNDIELTIVADNYEAHVSSSAIVPTASVVTWKGMTPTSVHQFPTSATWVLNLNFAQDWETANSLSAYLLANAGTEKEITLRPKAGGKGFKVTAICTPGQIGGDGDTVATATVSLPVSGVPAEVAAV